MIQANDLGAVLLFILVGLASIGILSLFGRIK